MTRFFLYALLALVAGTALAVFLQADPGYLLLSFRGWQLETTLASLIVAALLLGIAVVVLLWLLRLLNPLRLLRGESWHWFGRGAPEQASLQGLQQLLLGRWQEAYKLLVENAERVQNPVFNYLAAAIAAQERGDALGCQFCLDRAEKKCEGQTQGIRSLRAMLERRTGHVETALSQLLALKRVAAPCPLVLRNLYELQLQVSDWEGLSELLPELEKLKVLDAAALQELGAMVWRQRIAAAARENMQELRLAWKELPKALRHDEQCLASYVEALLAHNEDAEVGTLLTQHFKQHWSDNLVGLLGFVRGGSAQHLLLLLEAQLKQRPNNPVLMLTLGRLCLREQLWGKARDYFEHAQRVTRAPALRAEISAELARLLDHLGDRDESLAYYEQAMGMLQHQLPELPMPTPRR